MSPSSRPAALDFSWRPAHRVAARCERTWRSLCAGAREWDRISAAIMITRRRLFVLSSGSVLASHLIGSAARAQKSPDWPNRVVRIVVPVAAGGPTDTVARVLAEQLAKIWGHQVVVENKGGAGTNLGNA